MKCFIAFINYIYIVIFWTPLTAVSLTYFFLYCKHGFFDLRPIKHLLPCSKEYVTSIWIVFIFLNCCTSFYNSTKRWKKNFCCENTMRLAEDAGDLANTKFFFHLLAYTHIIYIQKTPESFFRFRRFFINLLCCKIRHILFNDFPTWKT